MREFGWHQHLTKAEEARLREHLQAHPEARGELELERALTRLLDETPDAPPVASNFTAQVMQAVARERAQREREVATTGRFFDLLRRWLPTTAGAGALAAAALVTLHVRQVRERQVMAERVATMASAFSTLGREPVDHFEPIRRLGDAPPAADTELSTLVASMK